jgi:hypothetical protein
VFATTITAAAVNGSDFVSTAGVGADGALVAAVPAGALAMGAAAEVGAAGVAAVGRAGVVVTDSAVGGRLVGVRVARGTSVPALAFSLGVEAATTAAPVPP